MKNRSRTQVRDRAAVRPNETASELAGRAAGNSAVLAGILALAAVLRFWDLGSPHLPRR